MIWGIGSSVSGGVVKHTLSSRDENGLYERGEVAEALGELQMVMPWDFMQLTPWLRQNAPLSATIFETDEVPQFIG